MLSSGGLWFLLVLAVGAYGYIYDVRPDLNEDIAYYDDALDADPGFNGEPSLNDLMMIRMLNLKPYHRSAPNVENMVYPVKSSEMEVKFAMVKKREPASKAVKSVTGVKGKPAIRQKPRWRIKRPPGLCLLKVCSPFSYVYE